MKIQLIYKKDSALAVRNGDAVLVECINFWITEGHIVFSRDSPFSTPFKSVALDQVAEYKILGG